MEEMIPCSLKDQEVFQRVWQRVMPGREEGVSPVEAVPPGMQGDLSCKCLEELMRMNGGGLPQECEAPGGSPPGKYASTLCDPQPLHFFDGQCAPLDNP